MKCMGKCNQIRVISWNQQQQPKMKWMNDQWNCAGICWSMAFDELFAMDGVHQEQDDNNETNYHPKNAYSSF